MVEDTYLFDWAEELVDKIAVSICDVISNEGGNDPVAIVSFEFFYTINSAQPKKVLIYNKKSGTNVWVFRFIAVYLYCYKFKALWQDRDRKEPNTRCRYT